MLTITGYADRISVRPGETIAFMVNCEHPSYRADIVQLTCADNSPSGPGFKERVVRTPASRRHKGRRQVIHAGSYAIVDSRPLLESLASFTVQAMIWPTTPGKGEQGILTKWDPRSRSGFALMIDDAGSVALRLGMADGRVETVSVGRPLHERHWYLAAASYDAASGKVTVHQEPLLPYARASDSGTARRTLGPAAANNGAPVVMAGAFRRRQKGRTLVDALYNGKIDSPRLVGRALGRVEIERMRNEAMPASLAPDVLCAWDFSRDITSIRISDRSSHHCHGEIVNLPARGMTGWNYSGEEVCWRHAPHEYGAIHFHDDDLYDAGWDVDFTWTVPARTASGVYAARLRGKGDAEEYVPFVVLPAPGKAARIAFLLPTVEYMAYANEHMAFDGSLGELLTGQLPALNPNQLFLNEHREYGASLYDTHSDGSGVCYSSRLRPILNMRPKVETPWACAGEESTNAREFILDMYVEDWLTHFGFEHDVITDEDVHREGIDLLKPYNVLITGGHPEYYSKAMRDAVHGFTQQGGRLMYLGGNGFYWRVAMHGEVPGVIEVRRCEAAIRTWEADPGEYYHSFTGEYGGLWRHQGDTAPQRLAGVGFVAEGFDKSSYYRRLPASRDPRARFIFEGIDEEIIGDFGYHGEGAAGNELDYADARLGTPPHALVVARSENHTDLYLVVNEEVLVNHSGLGGTEHEKVHADMVFYETPGGGAVFSVGSICYPASLPWKGYDNNIAKLTTNVLRRFADPEPF